MLWMSRVCCLVVIITSVWIRIAISADNASVVLPVSPAGATIQEPKRSGALASLVKMLIDIPMGIVEAFKDGADAIENTVVALMRGIF